MQLDDCTNLFLFVYVYLFHGNIMRCLINTCMTWVSIEPCDLCMNGRMLFVMGL